MTEIQQWATPVGRQLAPALQALGCELTAGTFPTSLAPKIANALQNFAYRWPDEPVALLLMDALGLTLERADVPPSADEQDPSHQLRDSPFLLVIGQLPAGDIEDVVALFCVLGDVLGTAVDQDLAKSLKTLRTLLALPRFGYRNTLGAEQRNLLAEQLAECDSFYLWWSKLTNICAALQHSTTDRDLFRCVTALSKLVEAVDQSLVRHMDEILDSAAVDRDEYALTRTPLGALTTPIPLDIDIDSRLDFVEEGDEQTERYQHDGGDDDPQSMDDQQDEQKTNSWDHIAESTTYSKSLHPSATRKALGCALTESLDSAEVKLTSGLSLGVEELCAVTAYAALLLPCNPHDERLLQAHLFDNAFFPEGAYVAREISRGNSQFVPRAEIAYRYTHPVTNFLLTIPADLHRVMALMHDLYGVETTLASLFGAVGADPEPCIRDWLAGLADGVRQPVIRINSFSNELREFAAAYIDLPPHTVYCLLAAPNHAPVTDSYYAALQVSRLRRLYLELVAAYLRGDGDD